MADPFIGQIKMFAGNFAPREYAFCHGQLLPIASNTALFSLLGTIYGGDGESTLGLPDLRGRAPMHYGNGPGLTPRSLGGRFGKETHPLTVAEIPNHDHDVKMRCNSAGGFSDDPDGKYYALPGDADNTLFHPTPDKFMGATKQDTVGNDEAHENMSPFQVINFIIALTGTYPSPN